MEQINSLVKDVQISKPSQNQQISTTTMKTSLIKPGSVFGWLTVVEYAGREQWDFYWCVCRCENKIKVRGSNLTSDRSTSCGCKRGESRKRHGHAVDNKLSPEYQSYKAAKSRCLNPRHEKYSYYGGRGIKFRFNSFEQFLAEVGKRPTKRHTLDRINNDGHYEPGNVQWATRAEQALNRRPKSR